jgi:HlyD family secretion protein
LKKKIVWIVAAVIALLAAIIVSNLLKNRKPADLQTTGVVEGTEVNVSSMIAGRIVKQCCREGDTVRNGQVLVELESDELKASEERAQAAVL